MPSDNPQTKATNKYHKKAYDRINIIVKKGEREKIQEHARNQGKSLNGYVVSLIEEDMKK